MNQAESIKLSLQLGGLINTLWQALLKDRVDLDLARNLLWLRHGCPSSALYGDDG